MDRMDVKSQSFSYESNTLIYSSELVLQLLSNSRQIKIASK